MDQPGLTPAQRALVEAHLHVVKAVVGGVAAGFPSHTDREELRQAGALGLVEAALRWDASRGVPFERWAALRIRGAVLDAVRSLDPAARSTRRDGRLLEQARTDLVASLGRTPTSAEVADRLGCTLAELGVLEGRLHRGVVLSLDVPTEEGDVAGLALSIADDAGRQPEALMELRESQSYLRDALACLPDRLQEIVVGYFLGGESSADLAARLGITESRISQLRAEALTLMRDGLSAAGATPIPLPRSSTASARSLAYEAALRTRSDFSSRLSVV